MTHGDSVPVSPSGLKLLCDNFDVLLTAESSVSNNNNKKNSLCGVSQKKEINETSFAAWAEAASTGSRGGRQRD